MKAKVILTGRSIKVQILGAYICSKEMLCLPFSLCYYPRQKILFKNLGCRAVKKFHQRLRNITGLEEDFWIGKDYFIFSVLESWNMKKIFKKVCRFFKRAYKTKLLLLSNPFE